MKFISSGLEETKKIAEDFVSKLSLKESSATVVGLYGDLGAGKTTFTQAIAKSLNVAEKVASPTFVIEKIYELQNQKFSHMIHIDAYRIEHSSELIHVGWKEITSDPTNLILIEWPERVADIMPEHVKIKMKVLTDESSREIEII